MMEGSGKVLATRDIDEMRAALAAGDQQRFSKHCRRIEQELTAGEHVVLLASCVSGKPALLAITNQRTLFVFKPDAITPMKVVARHLDEYDSVYAVASDVVNLHRPGQQVVGFQQLRPPIADQITAHVWDALGLRPEATPAGLPTRELGVVTRVLEPYAEAPLDDIARHLVSVLDDTELISELAVCRSGFGSDGIVVATDGRLLLGARDLTGGTHVTPMPMGLITAVKYVGPRHFEIALHSSNIPAAVFPNLRPAVAASFRDRLNALGAGSNAALAKPPQAGTDQNALKVLPAKTMKLVGPHIAPNEDVFVCLVGASGQALIALGDRVLIAKAGFMSGNAFGGKVNSFPYREITGIEIHTGLSTAALVIQTPSFQGLQAGGYWSSGKAGAFEAPNIIPLPNKRAVAQWQQYLSTLRTGVASGGLTKSAAPAGGPPRVLINELGARTSTEGTTTGEPRNLQASQSISQELEKLAALQASGVLSDEEFAQAKAKLLS